MWVLNEWKKLDSGFNCDTQRGGGSGRINICHRWTRLILVVGSDDLPHTSTAGQPTDPAAQTMQEAVCAYFFLDGITQLMKICRISVKSEMCSEWWANRKRRKHCEERRNGEIQGRTAPRGGQKRRACWLSPTFFLFSVREGTDLTEEDASLHPKSAQEKYMRGFAQTERSIWLFILQQGT